MPLVTFSDHLGSMTIFYVLTNSSIVSEWRVPQKYATWCYLMTLRLHSIFNFQTWVYREEKRPRILSYVNILSNQGSTIISWIILSVKPLQALGVLDHATCRLFGGTACKTLQKTPKIIFTCISMVSERSDKTRNSIVKYRFIFS